MSPEEKYALELIEKFGIKGAKDFISEELFEAEAEKKKYLADFQKGKSESLVVLQYINNHARIKIKAQAQKKKGRTRKG